MVLRNILIYKISPVFSIRGSWRRWLLLEILYKLREVVVNESFNFEWNTFEFLKWAYGRLWRCSQLNVSNSIGYDIFRRRVTFKDFPYVSLLFLWFSSNMSCIYAVAVWAIYDINGALLSKGIFLFFFFSLNTSFTDGLLF